MSEGGFNLSFLTTPAMAWVLLVFGTVALVLAITTFTLIFTTVDDDINSKASADTINRQITDDFEAGTAVADDKFLPNTGGTITSAFEVDNSLTVDMLVTDHYTSNARTHVQLDRTPDVNNLGMRISSVSNRSGFGYDTYLMGYNMDFNPSGTNEMMCFSDGANAKSGGILKKDGALSFIVYDGVGISTDTSVSTPTIERMVVEHDKATISVPLTYPVSTVNGLVADNSVNPATITQLDITASPTVEGSGFTYTSNTITNALDGQTARVTLSFNTSTINQSGAYTETFSIRLNGTVMASQDLVMFASGAPLGTSINWVLHNMAAGDVIDFTILGDDPAVSCSYSGNFSISTA